MKKILNVLYQSNDYYAPVTGVSMTSLMENNKHIDEINMYILNDEISDENMKRMHQVCEQYKRNIFVIDTKQILKKLKDLNVSPFKGTYTTYFKLMAIKSLTVPGDRILQLDGDTIITGPLDELCDMDLNDYLIAATYDCTLAQYKELIDIPLGDKYYNCGVLLINQKKWVEENCEEQIVNHLRNVRNGYYTVDQDILNVLFRNEFKYLDIKYNFNSGFYIYGVEESLKMYNLKPEYYNTKEEIYAAYDKPILYHCMGAMTGRPWEEDSIHPQTELFDEYLKTSPWNGFNKAKITRRMIFRIQRRLYLILPRALYIPIHKAAHMRYFKKENKNVQSK